MKVIELEFKDMDLETAVNEIEQAVYDSCGLYEKLEHAGKIAGNGHHIRQKVASMAGQMMKDRFRLTNGKKK